MPFIDTPQGRFEGTQAQIDAYKAALNPTQRTITPTTPDDSPDRTTGADFMTRLGASFKMTPSGKLEFMKHAYGDGNVMQDEKGEFLFRNDKRERWKQFDEKGVTLADLADFGGDAPGLVLSTLGGAAGTAVAPGPGSVAGAAGGAALGDIVKQGISGVLPGSDQMSLGERALSTGIDAALGAGSQFLGNKAMALRDLVRPHNIVANSATKAENTLYAAEGAQLSASTGIPLSFAQETGSRAGTTVEGMARRNPVSADSFATFDRLQTGKAVERIKGIMDDIHSSEVGDVNLGQSAQRSFDNLWDRLISQRRGAAARDFGAVDKLSNGSRVIPTTNTQSAIDDLIKEMDVPGGGDATAALVNRLKSVKSQLGGIPRSDQKVLLVDAEGKPLITQGPPEKLMTAEELNRLLQIYGKAASGNATIFQDLDKAQQRFVAGRIHNALTQDMDAAASSGIADQQVAGALKQARDNYAKNSAALGTVEESIIGRYFGNVSYERTPERIADAITRMKPTEIRSTLGILKTSDPEITDKTARYFLEKALDAAAPPPSAAQGGAVKFTASRFLSALPDDATQQVLFGGRPAQGELAKVAKVLERVADRPMEGSPTAPLMMAWDLAKGLFTLNPTALAGIPVSILAPRAIARAALTPQGRQALITVSRTGKPTTEALHAAQYLAALNAKEGLQDTNAAIAAVPNTVVPGDAAR